MSEADYKQIEAKGMLATAVITGIEVQDNVTVNGRHPAVVAYRYTAEGKPVVSEFKAYYSDYVERLGTEGSITIKHLDGRSIVPSLERFDFSFAVLLLLPLVLLIVGLSCLAVIFYTVRRDLRLYRFGLVIDAEVIGMMHSMESAFTRLRQGVKVQYQYTAQDNRTYLGESFSADVSF